MRPRQASARVCVLQPTPGRAHCSRPKQKARDPRPARKAQQLRQGWAPTRPQSRQPRSRCLAGTPRPLRRVRESQARLGFHCTFIPCFTPCIPERTVFNHFRLVGSDSKDPHQHPSGSVSGVYTHENKHRASLSLADSSYLKNKLPPGARLSCSQHFGLKGNLSAAGSARGLSRMGFLCQAGGLSPELGAGRRAAAGQGCGSWGGP